MQVIWTHEVLHRIRIDSGRGPDREMVVDGGSCRVAGVPDGDDPSLRQVLAIPDPQASVADEAVGRHHSGEGIQFGHWNQDRGLACGSEEATTGCGEVIEGQGIRMARDSLERVGRWRLVLEEGRIAEDVIVVTIAADGPHEDICMIYRDAMPVVRCFDVVHRVGTGSFVDVDGIDAGMRESLSGHEGQQTRTRADVDDRRCTVERCPCSEDAGILRDLHRRTMLMDGEGAHGEETGGHGRTSDGRRNESRN